MYKILLQAEEQEVDVPLGTTRADLGSPSIQTRVVYMIFHIQNLPKKIQNFPLSIQF
jgi:hypothetical protein